MRHFGTDVEARRLRVVSVLWGFCEATFFFVVPDYWTSRIAIRDKREALINTLYATLGAVLGGVVLYLAARAAFPAVEAALDHVPGVSAALVAETGRSVVDSGLAPSMLGGMTAGVPYKIYAAWAASAEVALWLFVLISLGLRWVRFALVTGATAAIVALLERRIATPWLRRIHTAAWVGFYIFYFSSFGF